MKTQLNLINKRNKKKTGGHIKLVCILAFCSIFTGVHSQIKDFNEYKKINESEKRLIEYKDDDEILKLKLQQLEVINKSRGKHKVPSVKLDILASRVANKMSQEAAENNYVGHWNIKGEKPYHRYAFAGGYDHISENASGKWVKGTYFNVNNSTRLEFMKEAHLGFMAERPPFDGHKQTCIRKEHNFVGIGLFLNRDQFRYYEEFIDRYYTFEGIPKKVRPNEKFTITVTVEPNNYLVYLVAYREKHSTPIKLSKLSKMGGYQDYSLDEYANLSFWDIEPFKVDSQYTIPLSFEKKGWYYIHIYQDNKKPLSSVNFSTKGKIQGSGIVIKVEK